MKTILVAEDHDASREPLNVLLTAAGYDVILAAHGEEALTRTAEIVADLVILDIHMPGPAFATVPVIALTASAMAGDRDGVA